MDLNTPITEPTIVIPRPCPNCGTVVDGKAELIEIPHWKDVAFLILDCHTCGKKTETYKSGHRVEDKGERITITVNDKKDFRRRVLKSETCTLKIPSLGLEVPPESLGGKYMPLSNFLAHVLEDVKTSSSGMTPQLRQWIKTFRDFMDGKSLPTTLIFEDPTGNTFVQNFSAPDVDSNVSTEYYERDEATNKRFGIEA
ncbi:nucleolar zinc-finger protein [Gaertneriomyces sp. JEL0708]|nr:nucleolar zinc-finger protein [Gaertneriomyces sp. JEL0708]